MPQLEVSSEIAAPPDALWALLCDTPRYPEWITVTDEVLGHDDGEMRVGYRYQERGGVPPFKGESNWTVTEFTPHSRQVHVGDDGAVTMHLEIILEPTGAGTRITQKLAFKPRWFLLVPMSVMWALVMGKRGRAALEETQANAKKILEAD